MKSLSDLSVLADGKVVAEVSKPNLRVYLEGIMSTGPQWLTLDPPTVKEEKISQITRMRNTILNSAEKDSVARPRRLYRLIDVWLFAVMEGVPFDIDADIEVLLSKVSHKTSDKKLVEQNAIG